MFTLCNLDNLLDQASSNLCLQLCDPVKLPELAFYRSFSHIFQLGKVVGDD